MTRTGIDYQKGIVVVWPPASDTPVGCCISMGSVADGHKKKRLAKASLFFGDPYGNRTHVTAVKGRCLNRLTNGPGSGDLTRTGDRPGMNRVLYQLSYAAIIQVISELPKSASLLYPRKCNLSSIFQRFFCFILGNLSMR